MLLQLVAKGLLTGYKQQFSDLGLLGLARYVAGQAKVVVAELNPVVTRWTDESHLRDRDFHLAAFRWREEHRLSTVAHRLKKRLDRGADAARAFGEVQNHLVATARAHVERLILEQFAAAVEALPSGEVRRGLSDLCDLYALERIEHDCGWFLEHGYLEANKSKAIRKMVDQLCSVIRDDAEHLVNAFGIS